MKLGRHVGRDNMHMYSKEHNSCFENYKAPFSTKKRNRRAFAPQHCNFRHYVFISNNILPAIHWGQAIMQPMGAGRPL